jgi:hypothetical protein
MKKTGYSCLLAFIWCFLTGHLPAQTPIVFAPDADIEHGSEYSAPIRIKNFQKITGLQFALSWDSSALNFKGLHAFGLDLSLNDHFGLNQTSGGVLRFLWLDPMLGAVSLEDSATLFAIRFEVTGPPDSETTLVFRDDDVFVQNEIYNDKFEKIEGARFESGTLKVAARGTSAGYYISKPGAITLKGCYPNPFAHSVVVDFELARTSLATLEIIDATGKLIFREERQFGLGEQNLRFDRGIFPQSGMFFLRMRSADFFIAHKLIVL